MNENLIGIAGGVAMGFFGSKLMSGIGKSGAIPPEIDALADKIIAYDSVSEVMLARRSLYAYIDQGTTVGFYAFTISSEGAGVHSHISNPQVVMSVHPTPTGCLYEFGSHCTGGIDIYYGGETTPRLTIPTALLFEV